MLAPHQRVRTILPLTIHGRYVKPNSTGTIIRCYKSVIRRDYLYDVQFDENDIVLPVLEDEVVVIEQEKS